jgi:hypothetical protein
MVRTPLGRAEQTHVRALVGEDPHRHHTRPVVHHRLERERVIDREAVHVQDVLAVVSDQRLPILQAQTRLPAQRGKLAHQPLRGHGDHLHRQRKTPQPCDPLGLIGDAHEAPGLGGHDFFARQRRPPAFDHVAARVDLVRTVNVDRQRLDLVGVEHRHTDRAQPLRRSHGAGDRPRDTVAHGGQRVDETVDRRSGTHADDFARLHIRQGGLTDQGLEGVWAHGGGRGIVGHG